uniref:Uncharacterized protein n=1 Tax=Nelumbo nucifera TaxID=4432 RepID=A0A822YQS0_NELNU|nr:TPA_asm: hypothetical protein HUJ06_012782 [Nelumbo nucifera]
MMIRTSNASPELLHQASCSLERPDDPTLEGVAVNVRLLLKLIQDHQDASTKEFDDRKMQRVASMLTILDDVKARIQKTQTLGRRRMAVLRRCNTDLKLNNRVSPREKKPNEPVTDENQRLRRELSASMAARKSLERMFSGLGKEKEIIAGELSRKVHELKDTKEHLSDVKAQNKMLLAKVKACTAGNKDCNCRRGYDEGNAAALQERNKLLSENLLRSLDGYRFLTKKLKESQDENTKMQAKMAEMGLAVSAGLKRIQYFRQLVGECNERQRRIEKEMAELENIFQRLEMKVCRR